MKRVFQADIMLMGALVGTLAHASPPMHPGAGAAVVDAWQESAPAQANVRPAHDSDGAYGSIDTDWQASDWMTERFADSSLLGDGDALDEESDVARRAREVQEEANQRWYGRRVRTGTPLGGEWYPEEAGWVSPEGEPDAAKWPWWLF